MKLRLEKKQKARAHGPCLIRAWGKCSVPTVTLAHVTRSRFTITMGNDYGKLRADPEQGVLTNIPPEEVSLNVSTIGKLN